MEESLHNYNLDLFLKYLIVGGLPECVKIFVESKNISTIRDLQEQTYKYYSNDASKYDVTYSHHLTSFASLKWMLLAQEL